jgi:hypothetical protein
MSPVGACSAPHAVQINTSLHSHHMNTSMRIASSSRLVVAAAALGIGSLSFGDFVHVMAHRFTNANGHGVIDLYAGFDDPQDELLAVRNATLIPLGGICWTHADFTTGLAKTCSSGAWNPQFGQAFTFDDGYLTIGGTAGTSNSTFADLSWGMPGWVLPLIPPNVGWFNANPSNGQGIAGNNNPVGLPCLSYVLLGRFPIFGSPAGAQLRLVSMDLDWTSGGVTQTSTFGPHTWSYAAPPPCPQAPTTFRAFRFTGSPNNTPWAWRIAGPSIEDDIVELNVPGVLPGAFGYGDARDLAKAAELSIKAKAAALGCAVTQFDATHGPSSPPPGLAYPPGCGPTPANSALLTVRFGDPGASTPTWTMYVGPAGCAATCPLTGCVTPCVVNPSIVEIPLSGEDCNENGIDDVLDVLQGTSTDADENLVLDECESADPCTGGSGSCGVPHGTPGCSDEACCEAACGLDPFCCDIAWDMACVRLAAILCAPPIGDFDGDFAVNGADLAILLGAWGTPNGDLNDDELTDGADLALLLGNWSN